jgi:hypothetical protein
MFLSLLALLPPHTVSIDLSRRTPISPYIYGANFAPWEKTGRTVTLNRQGGNRMSAYNWETNASNAGNDYHNQNDGYMGESNEPGWTVRTFLQQSQANGAAVLLTVPTMGYVAADKNADGDVGNTPNYLDTRFHRSLAQKNAPFVYPPDSTDKFVYQDEFVHWVESIKDASTPVWFSLDNEPDLWGSTHHRVWNQNPTYAQIVANNVEFASAIKAQAPDALVFGPANYGWQGFRTFQNAPDANGRDFTDYYLEQMRIAGERAGKRLLDAFDIHWYPEAKGGGVRIAFGEDKPGTAEARIQAPRSLWDATYVEDSWIAETLGKKPIALLPRLREQIAKNYPGTKLAITEYNYGGGKNVSGLLAEADVLGIFGREGVFAACVFGMGADDASQIEAFKAYRDFDVKGAKFGDVSVRVTGVDAADESVYAALDSKDRTRLTTVVINKTNSPRTVKLNTGSFLPRSGSGYVRGSSELVKETGIKLALRGRSATLTMPAMCVATVELRSVAAKARR